MQPVQRNEIKDSDKNVFLPTLSELALKLLTNYLTTNPPVTLKKCGASKADDNNRKEKVGTLKADINYIPGIIELFEKEGLILWLPDKDSEEQTDRCYHIEYSQLGYQILIGDAQEEEGKFESFDVNNPAVPNSSQRAYAQEQGTTSESVDDDGCTLDGTELFILKAFLDLDQVCREFFYRGIGMKKGTEIVEEDKEDKAVLWGCFQQNWEDRPKGCKAFHLVALGTTDENADDSIDKTIELTIAKDLIKKQFIFWLAMPTRGEGKPSRKKDAWKSSWFLKIEWDHVYVIQEIVRVTRDARSVTRDTRNVPGAAAGPQTKRRAVRLTIHESSNLPGPGPSADKNMLKKLDEVALGNDSFRFVAVTGPTGSGKSYLATSWCSIWHGKDRNNRYCLVLDASDRNKLGQSLDKIMAGSSDKKRRKQSVKTILPRIEQNKKRRERSVKTILAQFEKLLDFLVEEQKDWIIVFDDVPETIDGSEGPEGFQNWFFPSTSNWWNKRGKVIITTRLSGYNTHDQFSCLGDFHIGEVRVKYPDSKSAFEMFVAISSIYDDRFHQQAVENIVRQCENLPLAIVKANLICDFTIPNELSYEDSELVQAVVTERVSTSMARARNMGWGWGVALDLIGGLADDVNNIELEDVDIRRGLIRWNIIYQRDATTDTVHPLSKRAAAASVASAALATTVAAVAV